MTISNTILFSKPERGYRELEISDLIGNTVSKLMHKSQAISGIYSVDGVVTRPRAQRKG